MEYILLLDKLNIDMSRFEAKNLLSTSDEKLIDNFLIIQKRPSMRIIRRLAMTKSVGKVLFKCKISDIENNIMSYSWNKFIDGSYCVRAHRILQKNEKQFANLIYNKLKKPKVKLKNPKCLIEFYIIGKMVYVLKNIYMNNENYVKRKAHLRPRISATSMDPKLSRACVNLTGVKSNVILDPFCGSGGMLIEAGLVGLNVVGYDIDSTSLDNAAVNLDFYGVKKYNLKNKSCLEIRRKYKNVVTDLPYGQSSKVSSELGELYTDFFNNLYKILLDNAVVIFPHYVDSKKYLRKFRILNRFSIYIHKSLTKEILVITAKK